MSVMEERVDPASQIAVFPRSDSPYAPPQAVVADPAVLRVVSPHYVVGARKFFLLYLLTWGLYGIYWFYLHWARIRTAKRQEMWPAARAIFPVFFTHSLARELDESLRKAERDYTWSPTAVATTLVVLQFVSSFLDRWSWSQSESAAVTIISIALLLPIAGLSWSLQHVANLACDEPTGDSNRRLTWANGLWLAAGTGLLVVVLMSFLVSTE